MLRYVAVAVQLMGMEANFDLQLNSATRCCSSAPPPPPRGRGHDSKWKRQRRYAAAVAAAAVQQVASHRELEAVN